MIKNNPIFAGEYLNAQKVRRKYDQMVKKARVDWCNSHANLSGKDGKLAHLDQIIKTLAMAHEKKSADATAKTAKKKKQDTTLARHEQSLMHGPDGMYSPAKDPEEDPEGDKEAELLELETAPRTSRTRRRRRTNPPPPLPRRLRSWRTTRRRAFPTSGSRSRSAPRSAAPSAPPRSLPPIARPRLRELSRCTR